MGVMSRVNQKKFTIVTDKQKDGYNVECVLFLIVSRSTVRKVTIGKMKTKEISYDRFFRILRTKTSLKTLFQIGQSPVEDGDLSLVTLSNVFR